MFGKNPQSFLHWQHLHRSKPQEKRADRAVTQMISADLNFFTSNPLSLWRLIDLSKCRPLSVCVCYNPGALPSFLPHYCEDSSTAGHSRTSLWGSSSPSRVRPQTPWRTCSHSWGCLRSRPTASLAAGLWGELRGCTHSWRAPPLCRHGSPRSPPLLRWWHK